MIIITRIPNSILSKETISFYLQLMTDSWTIAISKRLWHHCFLECHNFKNSFPRMRNNLFQGKHCTKHNLKKVLCTSILAWIKHSIDIVVLLSALISNMLYKNKQEVIQSKINCTQMLWATCMLYISCLCHNTCIQLKKHFT